MRILAIRGCNLASLAGEFELDLASAPLGGAGVFAIVGNTGAGKSTLLDAMCVALFDRTPRLGAPSRVQVGRGPEDPLALGASDVRTLLRRGATTGYAEVDFESGDARRYRARWQVRRARGRGDGNLQDQQMTLTAIDGGDRLGGTKTETLREIQQRLGLSFEQFRRSALLAQGEFAAFLRSEGKDRSELLERMTGTEIYSRLSIAAHLRAAAIEARLRDARIAVAAITVMSDDDRARRRDEHIVAEGELHAARARAAAAEAAARWQLEHVARTRALAEADAALAHAIAHDRDAAPLRERLAMARRIEPLRARWEQVRQAERACALASADAVAAEAAASAAAIARDAAQAAQATRAATHEPIRAARIAAGLVERAVASRAATPTAIASARWLNDRAAWASEVAKWPELASQLAKQQASEAALAAVDGALAALGERRDSSQRARAAATAAHREAIAAYDEAQREAASFRDRRGGSLDAARRREDEARAKVGEAEKLGDICARADERARSLGELDHQITALDDAVARDAHAASELRTSQTAAISLRDERDRALAELRRIAGYAHARAELVDGEPCPLCGADDHPWRDRGAFDTAIHGARDKLAEAAGAVDRGHRELVQLAARATLHDRERLRLARARTAASDELAAIRRAWHDQLAALGELILEADPGSRAAAALARQRGVDAATELEAARAARSEAEASAKAINDAHAILLARKTDVDHCAGKLADLERQHRELESAIERSRGERAIHAEHARELAAAIAAAAARWQVLVGGTVSPSAVRIEALVREWRAAADAILDADAAGRAELAAHAERARAAELTAAELATRRTDSERRAAVARGELADARDAIDHDRGELGISPAELAEAFASPARIEELADELARRSRAVELARALVDERRRLVDDCAAQAPPSAAREDAERAGSLAQRVGELETAVARLAAELAADADARARRDAASAAIAADERASEADRALAEVIGSHDGKLLRSFAQSLTLDSLLAVANSHLEELAPRYQLERVPKHDLELQIIDRDLGSEIRSVQSLSGGESFLVSLALALGLSSMSAHDVRVRTLLIDEGFGTLDPATLDTALAVLDRLQATGRQVGVISHVPALVERVGAHVQVIQRGGGRSEVVVAQA